MNMTLFVVLILAGGVIGGLTNFLLTKTDKDGWLHFWRCVVSGIAAAFVVPLFLTVIQSSLLQQVRESDVDRLEFLGFCILAAFASRTFLENLAQKALRLANDAKNKTEQIEAKVEQLAPIVEKETEEDAPKATVKRTETASGITAIPEKPFAVLKSLINPSYTFRTVEGIAREANQSVQEAYVNLLNLKQKALANEALSAGGSRWYATAAGRALLSASGPANLRSEPSQSKTD